MSKYQTKLAIKVRWLCDNEETRKKGLMGVDDMKDDECAFFIMPGTMGYGFWNKNVDYDLSLAFVNDRFRVVAFVELIKGSADVKYPKTREAKYVVEVKRGIFEQHGVIEGDYLDFDADDRLLLFKEGNSKKSE
jgi:uncharacterized membrane protein (UPF0127 family)